MVIDGGWRYDTDRGVVTIDLTQTQDGFRFAMPMDIAIHPVEGAPRVERIQIDDQHRTFEFTVDGEPTAVVLDPASWVLMEASFIRR